MVKAISLRYISTVFQDCTISVAIMNSGGRGGVHKRFKNARASGVIIVLLRQFCFVWSKIIRTTLIKQLSRLNDWPVKLERDRCELQMINNRNYSPTYDLRSSCL